MARPLRAGCLSDAATLSLQVQIKLSGFKEAWLVQINLYFRSSGADVILCPGDLITAQMYAQILPH